MLFSPKVLAKKKETLTDYARGLHLIHFMVERALIHLSTDVGVTKEEPAVALKKGKGFLQKYCDVI